MNNTYDVIVIGSGSAGMSAVQTARSAGASVCLIEKRVLGGECPNFACVPSKALLKAASVYRLAQSAETFGISTDKPTLSFSKVMDYRTRVVETITGGGERGQRYEKILAQLDVQIVFGDAHFLDAHTIEVDGQPLRGKSIVVATGTVDFIPPITGLNAQTYWTWETAIRAEHQPKTMTIIGGGPVGCELATMYASFGTAVTVVQMADHVLPREDKDISVLAKEALETLGVRVLLSARTKEVKRMGNKQMVSIEQNDEPIEIETDQVVLATGKRGQTEGLGLEAVGVTLDDRGFIQTSNTQQTNIEHIFSAGDADGGLMFTHTAHHEGAIAGSNAALFAKQASDQLEERDERVVPRATFIHPEVASVGHTAAQVKEEHGKVLVGRYDVAALGRAVTESERFGLIKLVGHPETGQVLGGHMIGGHAGDVIHEVALAIHLGARMEDLATMIHAYPTFSQGVGAAAANAALDAS